ncbi:fatty acid desaturase [Sphingomonas profundi]|uniref:fatty acid desaturase n=1 Tax=Alterirhizorhabdus profundi TaxID=2681549 RepID=UPI001E5E47FA|nr:fatty acid desaturase [Sphingomonas profundi]
MQLHPGMNPLRRPAGIEIPTILLAAAIYGGWIAATWWHAAMPAWLLPVAGGWLIAWHGSLQHETIHGHPTGIARLDAAIGAVPLALWLPYAVYRRTHLAHHATAAVTDPFDDPESRYLAARPGWRGRLSRWAEMAQAPLIGRLLLGPPLTVARFLLGEVARGRADPRGVAREWLPHLAGVACVIAWLRLCGFDLPLYLLTFVYPGTALSLLRSFAEHRADADPARRVAVVEQAGPLALLFLNNNLHAAHHRAPGIAWYRLPAYYRRHRDRLIAANGGLLYRGYGDVARRFLLRPHDALIHPAHRFVQRAGISG